MGKILRVDLTKELVTNKELPDEATLRQYVGGTGLGVKIRCSHSLLGRRAGEGIEKWAQK